MSEPNELVRPFFSDVEKLFSEYVEYYGGTVIDKLETNKTDRKNADFLFAHPEIVAELKTFEKDVFSYPDDFPRFWDLIEKWIAKGLMSGEDLREYTFGRKQLPEKCNKELIERASKTVERALYKANKQIAETKTTYNMKNANGVIFLINDGNYFFSNQGILAVICNLIGRKFKESSFDVIVYFTINQVTFKEGSELDHNIWIPIYTKIDERGETIVSKELHNFINSFGKKFLSEFLTIKTGHKPKEQKQIYNLEEAIEEIKKHNFIPKDIIYKK